MSMPLQPSTEQIEAITAAFKNPPQAREHGIYFNGASYTCIRADKNSIYAKKVRTRSFYGAVPDMKGLQKFFLKGTL